MLKKLALILLLTIPILAESKPVQIRANPQMVSSAKPYTQVYIRIEKNPANRKLYLTWFNGSTGGSSLYELPGEEAQTQFFQIVRFRELGEYEVRATLVKNDESSQADSVTVIVR